MGGENGNDARVAAAGMLVSVLRDGRSLDDDADRLRDLQARDQAFARHLAYGVLRWLTALEWLAAELLDRPLRPRDRDLHYLLLSGLLQLWKDAAAPHAAVHATAEAARKLGKRWAVGLVNAVLRRFLRERDALLARLAAQPQRLAHPQWLLDELREDWPDRWPDIAAANNRQAPLWVRVNRRRVKIEDYLAMVAAAGLEARRPAAASDAVLVSPAVPVSALPGFDAGLASVQDAAAQIAADLVHPAAGERILDACAAPGGKTCHLLEREPDVLLTALDRSPERLELIGENLARLKLECDTRCADAAEPSDWWDGRRFDKILLDAPCSATGVVRRHPEIKWLRTVDDVAVAVRRQRALLESLWPLLQAGGILVYATCSVLKRENSKQIHDFLSRQADARCTGPGADGRSGRQIMPGQSDMDGFYYAVLRKRS